MVIAKAQKQWKIVGQNKYIANVRSFYYKKRNICLNAIEMYIRDFIRYTVPDSGFFFWIEIQDIPSRYKDDFDALLYDNEIILCPGIMFLASDIDKMQYRLSYSNQDEDLIHRGIRRLRDAILQMKSKVPISQLQQI